MQLFGNVATQPEKKSSKTTGRAYYEFRVAESQRGVDTAPTWYTVRVMKEDKPSLEKGDFVKVTGKLKAPDGHPNSPAYGHLKLPHLN